jgi:hypothetical protein
MENIHGNNCRRAMADLEIDAPGTPEPQNMFLRAWFIAMVRIPQAGRNIFPLVIYACRLHILPAYYRPQLSDYTQKWLHNANPLS